MRGPKVHIANVAGLGVVVPDLADDNFTHSPDSPKLCGRAILAFAFTFSTRRVFPVLHDIVTRPFVVHTTVWEVSASMAIRSCTL